LTKPDLGASVRERLLNRAGAQDRHFQELLQYYAVERFLYRLSHSRQAEKFILKGALLLTAWRAPLSRSTMVIEAGFSGEMRIETLPAFASSGICVSS
jgi:hypothetical protein